MIDVEQRLEQIAVRRDAAYRGAAETGAVIAAIAGDELHRPRESVRQRL